MSPGATQTRDIGYSVSRGRSWALGPLRKGTSGIWLAGVSCEPWGHSDWAPWVFGYPGYVASPGATHTGDLRCSVSWGGCETWGHSDTGPRVFGWQWYVTSHGTYVHLRLFHSKHIQYSSYLLNHRGQLKEYTPVICLRKWYSSKLENCDSKIKSAPKGPPGLWLWNPEETSLEVQIRGISGPTKTMTCSKKRIIETMLANLNNTSSRYLPVNMIFSLNCNSKN